MLTPHLLAWQFSSVFERNRAVRRNRSRMEHVAQELIRDRLGDTAQVEQSNSVKNPKNLVERLLSLAPGSSKENQSAVEKQLMAQLNAFLFAGHETTASTLSWIIHCLSQHQGFR
ncbi:hypothetical protein V8E36_004551 [Tilletia maclaganii]